MGFLQGDEGLDNFDSCVDIDASDVLLDHCTVAWGTEENIGMPGDGTSGHSIINSIIAEPLYNNPQYDDLRARNCLFGRSGTDIYKTTFVGNVCGQMKGIFKREGESRSGSSASPGKRLINEIWK